MLHINTGITPLCYASGSRADRHSQKRLLRREVARLFRNTASQARFDATGRDAGMLWIQHNAKPQVTRSGTAKVIRRSAQ